MSKAKLERLLNLTALLLETPRPLTGEEIRNRVAGYPAGDRGFRSAFERDKQELRELGIPLSVGVPTDVDAAPGGTAYRIYQDDYYLADPGLDAEEIAALHLAMRAVRLDGLKSDDALQKLEGATAASGWARGDLDTDLQMAALPARDDLGDLFAAVAGCRPVRFRYNGQDRTVDPYRIDFQRGRWYLNGFDHLRRDERVYRLDRIEGQITLTDGPSFSRPGSVDAGGSVEPWELGDGDTVTAQLLVDAAQAPWIVGHLGRGAVVEQRADGAVVVELAVTNRDSFRSFVLIFLEHAEVLGPLELREDLVIWLTKLAGAAPYSPAGP